MILLLLACADDSCEEMCVAAQARFEACLEEDGLEWGEAAGYTDEDDYSNWCETYTWELRTLGESDTCASRRKAVSAAPCDELEATWD